jgi:non-ribosomal peptide synthase protein (TIGR01720 family)
VTSACVGSPSAPARLRLHLDEGETSALLLRLPQRSGATAEECLLAAVVLAVVEARAEAPAALAVDIERHGREALFDDMELSRTVGWFTSLFPVWLPAHHRSIGGTLDAVRATVRAVPAGGIGYGLGRYLADGTALYAQLKALPPPQVRFNYLGQFDQTLSRSSRFAAAGENRGPARSAFGERRYALDILALVIRGRLHLIWTFDERESHAAIERIADTCLKHLRMLLATAEAPPPAASALLDTGVNDDDRKRLLAEMCSTEEV